MRTSGVGTYSAAAKVKGSRASRYLHWESGRESLAGDQETLAQSERAETTQGSVLGSGWVQEVGA